jgi:hypothetical protein
MEEVWEKWNMVKIDDPNEPPTWLALAKYW